MNKYKVLVGSVILTATSLPTFAVGAVPAIVTAGLDDLGVTFAAIMAIVIGWVVVKKAIRFVKGGNA